MKRKSIDEGIDYLVKKYIDDALSDENAFAAFRSKQKQPSSSRDKNLKKALYIELDFLLEASFGHIIIPVSSNSDFSVLHKNECMISFLGI